MDDNDFRQLSLSPEILNNLETLGFKQMTPIQQAALPLILENKDIIAQAKTGSGKTAAFGLGILSKLDQKNFWPQALIICPTRELAEQVSDELRRLARFISNIKILAICGGTSEYYQQRSLNHGAHIVVGTPGRIQKLIKLKALSLKNIKTLVLDEADRMLEMGFNEDIINIVSFIPKDRQTLLFSATFPSDIKKLSKDLQKDAKQIKIDHDPETNKILQYSFEVDNHKEKLKNLPILLANYKPKSCIIFCKTKLICSNVASSLQKLGISALEIHGDLEQIDRTLTLNKFSNKSCTILVATDVAARGLDIRNLEAVINYDIAHDPDIYIHRIGRTGRAGNDGLALNFFTPQERGYLLDIEQQFKRPMNYKDIKLLNQDLTFDMIPPMTTVYIGGGKKDKIRPGDILGALTGDIGLNSSDIGDIHIYGLYSYVAISTEFADIAANKLNSGKIKGRKFKVELA